ncbi:MAG: bifunctional serine/threonine-protein kinase/formylglycine-generating enzyme family protein [Synechocystis sp.]|nr:bifunctional serine/threonine-protein kinase/formylglycine-generating enzyme family protein [Synechocystis sp.]
MGLCINPDCEKAKKQEDQGLSLFCTGCGSSLLINDLYRVIKYLGGGGFGMTYLVDDCGTPKVLKILHNTDPKAIALFDQEALVLQRLNHPGIPRVETGGRFDYVPRGSQEPLRCLVMEYIEGETLEDYLAKNNYRPISEKAAVRWLQQLLEILALVHSANYFHRDIKPANVMLRSSGQIALIDFGTAREETQTYLQKMQGKGVTGIVSVGYTPHEQANGQAEYRSDFFAVGRTFVFLLTGKTPDQFQGSLKKGLIWQQEAQGYRQELRDLIDELMHLDVDERPINAQAILDKLQPLDDLYQTQQTIKVLPSSPPVTTTKPPILQPLPLKWLTRRNVLIGLGAVGVTGLTVFPRNVRSFTEMLPGGVPLEMIGIPAGRFMMGASDSDPDAKPNEKPAYLFQLKSFAIAKYPITRRQWLAITGLNLRKDLSYFRDFPDHPMEWVNFALAQEFCQKLTQITGKTYRLPGEAHWEYACRAGTTTRFYWGDDAGKVGDHAWSLVNSEGTSHEVGQKIPNDWGLYDMAGNVWEWCSNNWRDDYRDGANSVGTPSQFRAIRGGCWACNAFDSRSSNRQKTDKDYSSKTIGLRVIYQV